ncbi:MAG: hypothetical protein LM601_11225 [Candidatus Verstraetearchaeota archaeon]|nr:hypothetical protein [Candidatus Verstraetearchaeota archaeon]
MKKANSTLNKEGTKPFLNVKYVIIIIGNISPPRNWKNRKNFPRRVMYMYIQGTKGVKCEIL